MKSIIKSISLSPEPANRANRSTADNVFVKKTLENQWDEFKRNNHIMSVDMARAFDTISKKKFFDLDNDEI